MLSRSLPLLFSLLPLCASSAELPSGDSVIRKAAGSSEIVITTTSRLAGAIHSLTWGGRELIDSYDHGRQLQSASNLDAGTPIAAETYNPTEAGSRGDGAGSTSTSRLLFLHAEKDRLQTVTQMAFWLPPGEKSGPNPAKNKAPLSNHLLLKRVQIGHGSLPQVIPYDVTFSLPVGEHHTEATFEALTGYMPPEFGVFEVIDPKTGKLAPLSDGPGEQAHPIVFSTKERSHAMGIYAPPQPAADTTGPTYGRFRFNAERVVKWNCVFRVRNPAGVAPKEYSYRMFVAVGDTETVVASINALIAETVQAKPAGE